MIVNATGLDPSGPLTADICIVGAGPAGITIALDCARAGLHVIVLESGGRRPDQASQALCRGELAGGTRHPPPDQFRRRGLGGSTSVWGGRCVPLDPMDMKPRPWIGDGNGWPITAAELRPFWQRAAIVAEIGTPDFDAATAIQGGMRPMIPGFADDAVRTDQIERFSRPTDFGAAYAAQLQADPRITVLLHAQCTGLSLAGDGRAVGCARVDTESGHAFSVHARAFVLAAGGIENPRLLLASRDGMECGLGNQHGQVGRHYMCHLAGVLGVFTPAPGVVPFHGYQRDANGIYCRRRFSLAPWAQAAAGVGNVIARLHHPSVGDPSHGSGALSTLYLARGLLPREYTVRLSESAATPVLPHWRNLVTDAPAAAGFAVSMLAGRIFASRKMPSIVVAPPGGRYTFDVHGEQVPNPDSRITLGFGRDAFGVPLPRIDWRHSGADIHAIRSTMHLIAAALTAGRHGQVDWRPDQVEADILHHGAYGGHHLGATRMAEDPKRGVVDKDCRVHGTENLYVAGGSVFATSGQANPTLTILALALRLADHLKQALQEGQAGAAALPVARRAAVMSV